MHIDLSAVPWSRRGAWFSVSRPSAVTHPPLGQGLYLRSHHSRGVIKRELFLMRPIRSGSVVKVRDVVSPDILRLVDCADDKRRIEMVFDGRDSLRIRGRGLGLEMSVPKAMGVVAHPAGKDVWTVNIRSAIRRYQIERLAGRVKLDAAWKPGQCDHIRIQCSPGADGCWEIALDEFWSTWQPRKRRAFDVCAAEVIREWRTFLSRTHELAGEWKDAGDLAAFVIWSCTVSPQGNLKRETVFMSRNWMDQVWSWDNCFNMAALAQGHPRLALDQYLTIADHQDEFGAFPDAVNDGFKHYNFSKPPVQGILLEWVRERVPGFWNRKTVGRIYPSLAKFTRWWLDHRRMPGRKLCHYLHGNDSGWDNSTIFDRGVPMISPDLNAFLSIQAEVLADMARIDGRPSEAREWRRIGGRLKKELVRTLWKKNSFVGIRASDGFTVKCRSLVPCMPVVLGAGLSAAVRRRLVRNLEGFVTDHGLATELPSSPHYERDGYWRGPVWGPTTMLVVHGLVKSGERGLAARIARNFCRTCVRNGFAENHNALTGAPLRDRGYTWTAAAYLCLARDLARGPLAGKL